MIVIMIVVIVLKIMMYKSINDFDLRRLFYFKQGFKDTCYFPVYTSYKETNSTELIDEKVYNTSTKGNTSEVHQWALVQSNS